MQTTYQINFAEELKKCVKCGECRSNCPVFLESFGEPSSPRGRLALVKQLQQGKIKPSVELADKLYTCLLCKTCAVNCPSGVITDEIMIAARDYLEKRLEKSMIKRAILRGFLTRPALLQASSSLLKVYQKTGLDSLLSRPSLVEHLPEKIGAAVKIVPEVTSKPARKRISEVTPARGEKRFKVAYFLGCATNLIYPDVPVAGVKVLSRNGCEVYTPQLKCCGMPHLAYGDTGTMIELAKENMNVLLALNPDAIVTDCASCSSTLAESYEKLFEPGTPEHEQAKELKKKVYDISKFLIEKTGVIPGPREVKATVTYHDPCHSGRGQKIFKQPRDLLKSIPGIEFKDMKEADRCCGSAGSFSVMHHDLSMKILDKKISHVLNTKAEIVATSCPTCTMQLSYGLRRNGVKAQVVHPVQLLAESYQE